MTVCSPSLSLASALKIYGIDELEVEVFSFFQYEAVHRVFFSPYDQGDFVECRYIIPRRNVSGFRILSNGSLKQSVE